MQYRDLVDFYQRLGGTTKRLEMRKILAELLKPLSPTDLPLVVYLSQGQLRPEFEGVELGIAGSLAGRAVALAAEVEEGEVVQRTKKSGDLGTTAEELFQQRASVPKEGALQVQEVYDGLLEVARTEGEGAQERKVRHLVDLLSRATPSEAKYLIRLVLGTLRVGVREMTLLDALNDAFSDGSKESRTQVEAAFNLSSDLGLVATVLAHDGRDGLKSVHLEVGRPVRPMLAEREPSLEAVLERMDGSAALEVKYDGLRVQAHVDSERRVRLFSRRLEEIGPQFPELLKELPDALRTVPAIIEGECVPIDADTDEIRPFQEVSRRRGRKYDLERMMTEVPVVLFVFDVLLDGKEEVLGRDFGERRALLERLVRPTGRIRLAQQEVVADLDAATRFFESAVAAGGEGVMAKSLAAGSSYRAGARGFWWIKYKREYTHGLADSIDGVVVGGFFGRGRRAGKFGAFLLAVYNPKLDRYETFCKVGSGFDDVQLAEMPSRLEGLTLGVAPPSVETTLTPDRWFEPKIVLEVRGAELTLSPIHRAAVGAIRPDAGLALRFPRFTGRVRDDKSATEATTSQELVALYRSQVRQAATEENATSDDAAR